jgi:HPt (histidine-containing phosphotransfer) domain-containing protein
MSGREQEKQETLMGEASTTFLSNDDAVRLDAEQIAGRMDGDWQLLAELCEMAQAELPRMIESLDVAVRKEDADAVHRAAHRLIGSLSIFGPGPHIDALEAVQEKARNQSMAPAAEVFSRLKVHLDEFSAAVAALGKEAYARASR